jgi:hypothetical protein
MSSPIKRLVWIAAVLLAGFVILASFSFRTRVWTGGTELAMEFLARSPLGPLPAGATNVLFHRWGGPFTGEAFLRFELSPEEIETFIRERAEIASMKPKETYSAEHPLLPWPNDESKLSLDARYYGASGRPPDWWAPTILGTGRMYFLWPSAWLYFDEERGVVWFKVVKG